tara:strand:- start:56 stop:493 length:438 start_codon:yes stop_codon:yes gene_type:complete
MDRQKFKSIVQTYGAHTGRWPNAHRVDMLALLDTDPQARAILGREAALDSLLNAMEPTVSNTLEARIRNDMTATLGAQAGLGTSVPATDTSSETPPLRQAAGAFVVALAACLTLGIVTTPDIMGLVFGNDEMLLALDIVGNEFLN